MIVLSKDRATISTDSAAAAAENAAQAAVTTRTPNGRTWLRRVLEDYPFQVVQLASLPVVTLWLFVSGGYNLYRQLGTAVANLDPIGTLLVIAGVTWTLLATETVSRIKEAMRAADHDRAAATQAASLKGTVDHVYPGIDQVRRAVEEVADRVDLLASEITEFRSSEKHTRTNTPAVWANFAPSSVLHSVNGQCRFDVLSERRADGSVILRPSYERSLVWVKRYTRDGIGRANIVLFLDDPHEPNPTSSTPQIDFHLAAFRAVRRVAEARNEQLNLDRVHFYLQKRSEAKHLKTFIVAEYNYGGRNIPFVNSYVDHAAMFQVPRTMLDDNVDTYYSPDMVSNYRHLAEAITSGLPSYSLDDMERRYGRFVPELEFDPAFGATRSKPDEPDLDDDIVAFDDHLAIRRPAKH